MRSVMINGVMDWGHLGAAIGLNVLAIALGVGLFLLAFHRARRNGGLLHFGE